MMDEKYVYISYIENIKMYFEYIDKAMKFLGSYYAEL